MGGFVNLMERIEYIGKEIVYKEEDGKCPIMDGRLWVCLLIIPRSVRLIGDFVFGPEGGKIVIRD